MLLGFVVRVGVGLVVRFVRDAVWGKFGLLQWWVAVAIIHACEICCCLLNVLFELWELRCAWSVGICDWA